MKILVICQYYNPEPFRITNICEELFKRGHDISVITGIPNYPMGKIYEGYRYGRKRNEVINGVKVHRCFTIGRKNSTLFRFLNYYSYAISSTIYAAHVKNSYDVVFINQLSPVMMAYAGLRYAKKKKKKTLLYCLDLWPASLVAGGVRKGSIIYKFFHYVSAAIYAKADRILVTSNQFNIYLHNELQINNDKIGYLPQYAEDIFTVDNIKKLTQSVNKIPGQIDLVYAGNLGAAQSVDTIIMAAKELENIENLTWHIVGDGSCLAHCQKLAAELGVRSIIFHGRKPIEEMPYYYALADAMLVTLMDDDILSLTLPGKIQSYMAAGKPIIAAANGEILHVIQEAKCGYGTRAGDYAGLADSVKKFISDEDKLFLCKAAEDYYTENFQYMYFIEKLEQELQSLKETAE